MKKLRMIVTSVVVLAIVGSAFAFHAKIFLFCVLTSTDPDADCTTALDLPRRTTLSPGSSYKYYPAFDGDKIACSTTHNGHCIGGPITLTTD